MSSERLQPVARVTGAHGIRGEITAAPYGEFGDFSGRRFFVNPPQGVKGLPDTVTVTEVRAHKGGYLLFIKGIATRSDAERFKGCELMLPEEELPELEEDEHYFYELVGMEVVTDGGRELGSVTDVISSGGPDVLVVEGSAGEVLIPTAGGFILDIDTEGRKVTVRLLEGMLPGEG